MCFSPGVSITTFVLGILSSILVYTLNTPDDKIVSLFFGFVICMQLIEYLLWNHQICDNYNRYLSITGMLLNHIQPIILGGLILLFNPQVKKPFIYSLLLIYTVVISNYSLQFNYKKQCTIKNNHNHLFWEWNYMKYSRLVYLIFLIVLFLLFKDGLISKSHGKFLSIISLISYIISMFIYDPSKVAGALWCFFAVGIPVLWYVLRSRYIL